jgi:hypothetical protein
VARPGHGSTGAHTMIRLFTVHAEHGVPVPPHTHEEDRRHERGSLTDSLTCDVGRLSAPASFPCHGGVASDAPLRVAGATGGRAADDGHRYIRPRCRPLFCSKSGSKKAVDSVLPEARVRGG